MFLQSILMNILAIILACWLGHVTGQSSADDQELQIGSKGEGPPEKQEFPWGNNDFSLENNF
ncbi:uncharacterized protein LOC119550982 [Drosophila subpulchrella]|uniref:uncharacterized protein LOC119550982 n=1 Tax=Drosophila subpulchrella TaxID=1486046 RepID=UPI0018A1640F|nr:uncharacterized protein LOC119550982 [Drosophila subpulchrella]